MEVRCGHCNKLFRVADDKITGTGIRFKCTKCGESVTITSEDFQHHRLSQEAASVLDTFAPKPPKAPVAAPAEPKPVPKEPSPAEGFAFDIIEDHEAEEGKLPKEKPASFLAAPHEFGEEALAGAPPLATPEVKPAVKPVPAPPPPQPKPQPQPKPVAQPKPVPKVEAVPPQAAPSPPPVTERPAPVPRPAAAPTTGRLDEIHPLVSGSLAGSVGGIGCAIPVLAMTLLGVGAVSLLAGGKTGNLPLGQVMLLTGSSFIGFGVLIGIVLAFFQARTESGISGFLGVLIGGFLGALFGAVKGTIVAAGSGAVFSIAIIVTSAIGWGIKALLLSGAVVLARRVMVSSRTETSDAEISGGQLLGVGLAALVLFLGMFGEVRTALNMKTVKEDATNAFQDMTSAEGLQVTNSLASWDPATGDLVLNVTLENTRDAEKKPWYLVAEVYDASGKVLTTAKMLTGKQLYTQRDYEIMGRRGVNVQNFRMDQIKQMETPLAAHGVINVEMRVMEPPAGVSSFVATFQPFDLMKMIKEQVEEAAKQQQQPQR
jgi:predicted Zn finger-like uncharacterized protein